MAAIGLVVGDSGLLTAGDTVLQSTLTGAGHSVTVVDDGAAVPGGVDCFVITESGSPATLGSKYTALAVPVVTCEVGGWDDMLMTTVNGAPSGTTSGTTTDLLAHEITTGLTDPLTIYTASVGRYGVSTAQLGVGAVVFAQHPTTTTHKMGFAYDAGAALVGGGAAAARRVALPYIDSAAAQLAAGGQQLLVNAVAWALGGAPEPQTGHLGRLTTTSTSRPLRAAVGAATRRLGRLTAPAAVRPLRAAPGPATRRLGRVTTGSIARGLTASTSTRRDITIVAYTEPTSAWTTTEPTGAWSATEATSGWATTEPATGWQTTEPHA